MHQDTKKNRVTSSTGWKTKKKRTVSYIRQVFQKRNTQIETDIYDKETKKKKYVE